MTEGQVVELRPAPVARPKIMPDGVMGMLIFVFTEVMFFAGFISAFSVVRARADGVWPPPGQPTLPFEQTAMNTTLLLASGAVTWSAWLAWRRQTGKAATRLLVAIVLGAGFVALQGREWVALLAQGLTLTSSSLGSFFYVIVGAHGLHALAAISALAWSWVKLRKGELPASAFATVQVFWYFVVLIWPFIYFQVYR
ncbi:MAG: heme-copper oxidase subunit III [Deltaproteobacteria bacterium]|nr:MAG: heme-copper oxidase subunit III [Deltaproteobacteria bacterium]